MKQPYLSIIIPAYNEKENFNNGALDKVAQFVETKKFDWEVLIVDDGSTDGSLKLFEAFCKKHPGFRLIANQHLGKAGSVTKGVEEATGKYILFTDFDQATPISEWEELEVCFKKGVDIVIGSREVAGSTREKEPFYRHIMGRGFNLGVQALVLPGIMDTQCGFKAFKGEIAKELFAKLYVYKPQEITNAFTGAFDVELLFIARKLGYKIAEIPVKWQHVKTDRVSPLRDSALMAWDVVRIFTSGLMGKYGKK